MSLFSNRSGVPITMATTKPTRTVQVLCDENFVFGIGSDTIRAADLTLEQAELVAAQHPGQYVAIIEKKTDDDAQ